MKRHQFRTSIFFLYLACSAHLVIKARDETVSLDFQTQKIRSTHKINEGKKWTFIVYIAADNDLRSFAARNIKQMATVGSNDYLNIVVQLDIRITGNKKITRRYYIEQNKILHVNSEDPDSQKMDSGDPQTLVSCCQWAIENYPSESYALILWNHGTGIIDPETGRIFNPSSLFDYNPNTNKHELDRSNEFLNLINDPLYGICQNELIENHMDHRGLRKFNQKIELLDLMQDPLEEHGQKISLSDCNNQKKLETALLEIDRDTELLDLINDPFRGICWDDSTGHYLTNQKLEAALNEISSRLLKGKKLNILGFDACLMAMLEVANIAKPYAHIMLCSQEVELGAGWDYAKALSPFLTHSPDQNSFSKHIVESYHETYSKITNDYTQSAINLDSIDKLESNVSIVANLLMECLKYQKNNSVKNTIQASRSKLVCTHFDEPSYIDLHHLYTNLLANLKHFVLTDTNQEKTIKQALSQALEQGKTYITESVIANQAGKNLSLAKGISIYFPERRIHSSYGKTNFAATNKWIHLITQYLLT